jgi:hypothetical protein
VVVERRVGAVAGRSAPDSLARLAVRADQRALLVGRHHACDIVTLGGLRLVFTVL